MRSNKVQGDLGYTLAQSYPQVQGVFTLSNAFLPVMEATLRKKDEQPDVLMHAVNALTAILRAALVPHATLFAPGGVATYALAMLLHTSAAVRAAALHFLQAAAQLLELPELYALAAPTVGAVTGLDAHGCPLSPLLYGQPLLVRNASRPLGQHAPQKH